MTDNPCNCSTCPDNSDCGISNINCPMTMGDIAGEYPHDVVEGISKITGMLCHPRAREYLMRDVIEGLQYIVSEVDSAKDWETSLKQIREKAIALINGERK